ASEFGHPSSETIQQVFHQVIHGRGYRETLNLKQPVPKMPLASRGMNQYDAFFSQERGHLE
ncbi:IS21 family transposase, partial [Salipaludibacillus sp. CF4.18]